MTGFDYFESLTRHTIRMNPDSIPLPDGACRRRGIRMYVELAKVHEKKGEPLPPIHIPAEYGGVVP